MYRVWFWEVGYGVLQVGFLFYFPNFISSSFDQVGWVDAAGLFLGSKFYFIHQIIIIFSLGNYLA